MIKYLIGSDMRLRGTSYAMATLLILIASSWLSLSSQVNFRDLDIARIPEGNKTTRGTAQFLINRFGFTQEAFQTGGSIFHHNFADDEKSGCNGVPCELRKQGATRGWPESKFEAASCETCHNTPRASAGFGPTEQNIFRHGNRIRTNDMFGAGLIQQLGIEATEDLVAAHKQGRPLVTENGVDYGKGLGVRPGGTVNPDLVVRPFGRKGTHSHLRAFVSCAAFDHLGIQSQDRFQCSNQNKNETGRCDGSIVPNLDPDADGVADEMTQGSLSLIEFYLVNYPVPGRGPITTEVTNGEQLFKTIGCAECHRPEMRVKRDPRIEHITVFWNEKGNRFEAERRLLHHTIDDGYANPDRERPVPLVVPDFKPFVVPLYADLKRHDMGPQMADATDETGVSKRVFSMRALWGVGTYRTFLDDGSAKSLDEAILRHGGEALAARNRFARLTTQQRSDLVSFLESLVLFNVEDVMTAKIPITRGDLP
ncbi:MAG: di-heme oxidoredictase family protein [Pyrinomonadaceae bacterium]